MGDDSIVPGMSEGVRGYTSKKIIGGLSISARCQTMERAVYIYQ